ncbi:hypothetical protein IE81DRAFT_322684 [Ceraceosorus guamensis]|uniref:Nuclear segregation protein Bfr1 n=1 Tax=Ceraceosorus guamensis TaxID=1522189 RepID=A0A316W329_9BASI|nr:hypothetical protein IE81DRAFT_322684 [Ceraceosorus guamensis]PWN43173.1 hypothetical protein IE81DRAFT_322684 [Ceraceosorus guamensis]
MSTSTKKPVSNGAKANGSTPSKSKKAASSDEQVKPSHAAANEASAGQADDAIATSEAVHIAKLTGGKPDPDDNNAKLEAIKKEIDAAHAEINNLKSILSGSGPSKDTPEGQRRAALRAELDELRSQQAGNKGARGKVLDDLRAIQDGVGAKIKALQAAKSKAAFKSPEEVDAQIARLEKSVESGSMKLVEEKKALAQISNLKRDRKNVEAFATQQAAIDADRKRADELRSALDDPASKAVSKRYDEIKTELDEINKKVEASAGSRTKLLDQRNALSKKLDTLYAQRRDRQTAFRAANDVYYQRLSAERERKAAKYREERQAQDAAKRKEHEAQMREEASLPAFAQEIEDCDVLINYFSGAEANATKDEAAKANLAGVKELSVRQVEADASFGQALTKKGQEEEETFTLGGGKGKKGFAGGKGKKGKRGTPLALGESPADDAEPNGGAPAAAGKLNVPLGTLSALFALSIPPPTSQADLPRVVENLKLKKAYFVQNQATQTKLNIEKVEKALAKSSLSGAPADADQAESDAAPASSAA